MDYIQEEWLRQRRALEELMTGTSPREEREETEREMETEGGGERRLPPPRRAERETRSAWVGRRGRRSGQETEGRPAQESAPEERAPRERLPQERRAEAAERLPPSQERQAEAAERLPPPRRERDRPREAVRFRDVAPGLTQRGDLGMLPGETPAGGSAGGESAEWSGRPLAGDARRVSRVIQRDARRYDGGFSIS